MLLQMIVVTMNTMLHSAVLLGHSCIQVIIGAMPRSLCSLEFVQHDLQCKQAAPSTTACLVVPGFLLPVMRPFLKGMHILKTYRKGST